MCKGWAVSCLRACVLVMGLGLFNGASAEDLVYTFRPGDSLWKVCEQYARDPHACWQELAQRNGIASPRAIPAGARLRIPSEWLKVQPQPAQISRAHGELLVYRKQGGEPEFAGVGTRIELGDALETGHDGFARVTFADESWLEFRPDSLVVFDRYSRFRESGMVDTSLRLERGRIRTWVRPRRGERQRFIINTPSAAAAIRGTEFDLSVDGTETLRNEVESGAVEVEAEGVTRTVPAGYAVLARPGEPPQVPVKQLDAPQLSDRSEATKVVLEWPAVAQASAYRLALYRMPEEVLVAEHRVEQGHWETVLAPGDYRILARAEDQDGLRGKETELALAVRETLVEPAPEEPAERKWWDLLLFLGGAALLLSL